MNNDITNLYLRLRNPSTFSKDEERYGEGEGELSRGGLIAMIADMDGSADIMTETHGA
jgi:hypothetical protein